MPFDAGSAVAKYIIDTSQAKRALDEIDARIRKSTQDSQKTGGGLSGGLAQQSAAAKRALSDFEKLDRQYNQLRDSEVRAARASGDHARALSLTQSQLGTTQKNTVRYNDLLTRQSQIQRELAGNTRLSQQFATGFKDSLVSTLGPIALATGAANALFSTIRGGVAAAGEALALREQQNSLRAVAGSAELYAEAISVARQQQLLFGGTIRENLDGIQGLTIVSRESGASLQQLIDLTQRLQLKSPEQGVGGARIAITEALSGNITSLSRRFEIPKEALKGLSDTSLPVAERLALIDTYLSKIGISSETVSGRVDETAATFRKLDAEVERLQVNIGDGLATAFSRAGEGLARFIGLINDNPEAIAQLRAVFNGGVVTTEGLNQATQEVARREAVSATVTTGERLTGVSFASDEEQDNIARARDRLTEFIAAGGGAAETARGLAAQFQAGRIDSARLVEELDRLKNTAQGLGSPFSAAASGATEVKNALADQAIEALNARVEADKEKRVMDSIAAQSAAVRKGLISQADAVSILAGQLGTAAGEALNLQLQLDRAASIQAQKDAPLDSATRSLIAKGQAGQGKGDASARLKEEQEFRRAQEAYQRSLQLLKPIATQLAGKKSELAGLGADDPKRFEIMTDIARLQNQLENERERGAKSRTSELDKQLNLNERIYDSQQKQYQAEIDARLARNSDATQDILDVQRRQQAQNAINNARDPRIRALAQLELERIGLEDEKRNNEIGQLGATAGGAISANGRLLQSLAPDGGPLPQPGGTPGGATTVSGSPTTGAGSDPDVLVQVFLDSDEIAARQVVRLRDGLRSSRSAGGGGVTA